MTNKLDDNKGEDMSEFHLEDAERTPCEIWTRVMGYFRPLMNFNKGKVSEYNERKCFNQKIAMEHIKKDAD